MDVGEDVGVAARSWPRPPRHHDDRVGVVVAPGAPASETRRREDACAGPFKTAVIEPPKAGTAAMAATPATAPMTNFLRMRFLRIAIEHGPVCQ